MQRVKLLFDQLQKESMRVGQKRLPETQVKTTRVRNGGEVMTGGASNTAGKNQENNIKRCSKWLAIR